MGQEWGGPKRGSGGRIPDHGSGRGAKKDVHVKACSTKMLVLPAIIVFRIIPMWLKERKRIA